MIKSKYLASSRSRFVQHALPLFSDYQLGSYRSACPVIGDFFEELVSRMTGFTRLKMDGLISPDMQRQDFWIEVKAAQIVDGKANFFRIQSQALHEYQFLSRTTFPQEEGTVLFAFCSYSLSGLKDYRMQELRDALAETVISVIFMDLKDVRNLCSHLHRYQFESTLFCGYHIQMKHLYRHGVNGMIQQGMNVYGRNVVPFFRGWAC